MTLSTSTRLAEKKILGKEESDVMSSPSEIFTAASSKESEMVLRVAAAMRATSGGQPFSWESAARAAFEAMREPTWDMWDHAENEHMMLGDLVCAAKHDAPVSRDARSFPTRRIWMGVVFWRAMIDAALRIDREAIALVLPEEPEGDEIAF